MDQNNLVALIAEGSAEQAILEVLLDNNLLKFKKENVLKQKIIRDRSAKNFQKKYLDHSFGKRKLTIYRVLDSKNEKFKLSPAYKRKVNEPINLYTRPEIEILFIIYYDRYDNFCKHKSDEKASEYVKRNFRNIVHPKNHDTVYDFWAEKPDELVATIKKYAQLRDTKHEKTLLDILK